MYHTNYLFPFFFAHTSKSLFPLIIVQDDKKSISFRSYSYEPNFFFK